MGLFAGILLILTLFYGTMFIFQSLAAFAEPDTDQCRSSTSYTSMGVGFHRRADANKSSKKSKKNELHPSSPSPSQFANDQYQSLDDYQSMPPVRSPTVRSVV